MATSEDSFTNRETEVYVANVCSCVCVCVCVCLCVHACVPRVRYDICDEWERGVQTTLRNKILVHEVTESKHVCCFGEMLAGTVGITKL